MDENTIFQDENTQPITSSEVNTSGSQLPTQEKEPLQKQSLSEKQPVSRAPWQQSLPEDDLSLDDSSFFSSVTSLAIKALIGMVLIGVIIFVTFRFLIPIFNKSNNEKVTLTYWGLWEDKAVAQGIINDFQKENPNIIVSYVKEDIKQYRERLIARSNNDTGPDIFRFHNTWLPQLSGLLLPLPSDILTKEEFQKSFYPVVQQDVVKNGAIYGIPLEIDTLALFTNPELFQAGGVEVPTNWEDFGKVARVLTVKDESGVIKTSGAALGTFDNITHASDIISMLLIQNGTDLKNMTGAAQNASDALNFYTGFAKDEGKVWDDSLDPSQLLFAKGNLAMYFGYSWDIFAIKAINPTFVFEVHPVPHLTNRTMTIASYWVEGVSVKSKHQKEALLFMKFLAKKETQQKLFTESSKTRLFGEPYSRMDIADSLKSNTLLYPFVSQAKTASSSFFASDTYDNGLNSQMNGYLGNAVRAVLANTSAQSAADTLAQGISQILKQYGQ